MRNKLRYLAPNKLIDKLWLNYVSTDNESSWHFSWKGSWRRFRGNGDWNAEVSDQYAILLKILNDYKIKRKQRSSVLLKVALLWLSSEYRGWEGVSLQKKCLDVSCGGEKDPYFVYNIDQILACTRSAYESTVRAKWASERWVLQKKKMDRRWPRCLNPRTEDPGEGERKEVNSICDC